MAAAPKKCFTGPPAPHLQHPLAWGCGGSRCPPCKAPHHHDIRSSLSAAGRAPSSATPQQGRRDPRVLRGEKISQGSPGCPCPRVSSPPELVQPLTLGQGAGDLKVPKEPAQSPPAGPRREAGAQQAHCPAGQFTLPLGTATNPISSPFTAISCFSGIQEAGY